MTKTQQGSAMLATLDPEAEGRLRQALADVAPDFMDMMLRFPFAEIYSRPGLDLRSRILVTLSALAAMGTAGPQLESHVANGLRAGLSKEEIAEIFMQIAVYAGFPAALNALATLKKVCNARSDIE